jgi:hypothetical protein
VEDFDPFASMTQAGPASAPPPAAHPAAAAAAVDQGGDWAAFNEDVFTDFYDADEAPEAVGDGEDAGEAALESQAEGAGAPGAALPRWGRVGGAVGARCEIDDLLLCSGRRRVLLVVGDVSVSSHPFSQEGPPSHHHRVRQVPSPFPFYPLCPLAFAAFTLPAKALPHPLTASACSTPQLR